MGDDLVLVTGGEPLLQDETAGLLKGLIKSGAKVMLETNGSITLKGLPRKVHVVMDIKCPGSGESKANLWQNLKWLKATDEIKFVLTSRKDYQWAKGQIKRRSLIKIASVGLSPAYGLLGPEKLTSWIIRDRLPLRLNLQLHKIIWKEDSRGR